jgi:hypothetical protein
MSRPHNRPLREYLNLRPNISSEFPYPSASRRRRTRLRLELPSLRETRERAILEPLPSLEIDAVPSLEIDDVPSLEIDDVPSLEIEEQENIELCDVNEEHDVEEICRPLSSCWLTRP